MVSLTGYDWHNSCTATENITMPLKSDFATKMTCYFLRSCVQAHNLLYKTESNVFSNFYLTFRCNFYHISFVFRLHLYHNVLICMDHGRISYLMSKVLCMKELKQS